MAGRVEHDIKRRGRALGFADVRITAATVPSARQAAYLDFIERGQHGEMGWLAKTAERRLTPRNLWPDAKSAIICAMNYGPAHDPLAVLDKRERGAISVYAQNRDYHDLLKGKLKEMAGLLAQATKAEVKVFVDTAPILEKPLAQQAGIGWQGKHTNLVSREHGSWLFLGEILSAAELAVDESETDHCGRCRQCLDICPTAAFPKPYSLDARRCIAYLTIEHPGPIAREFRTAIGNRIYGCDDCLAVCPWNKFASASQQVKLQARPDLLEPELRHLLTLDDQAFRQTFQGSPVKRIGRARFVRNCLIAAGNSGDLTLISPCEALLADPSSLIRGAAVWALGQLLMPEAFQAIRNRHGQNEPDLEVRDEWESVV